MRFRRRHRLPLKHSLPSVDLTSAQHADLVDMRKRGAVPCRVCGWYTSRLCGRCAFHCPEDPYTSTCNPLYLSGEIDSGVFNRER